MKLTVGMATFDDYKGVWATVQALRMYHAQDVSEIVVVDNRPGSPEGKMTRRLIESWGAGKYVPFGRIIGTSVPRDQVFREASGDVVLVVDPHVLLPLGSLRKLLEWYESRTDDCRDMLQGPFLYDDLRQSQHTMSHMEPVWRETMFGTWGNDPRAKSPESDPFEIEMQGLGLFAMRRNAWLSMGGMSDRFRGFGAEEGNLHAKVRRAGGKVWCCPWLASAHRFSDPELTPVSYPNNDYFKCRNYLLWASELGESMVPICEHFAGSLDADAVDHLTREFGDLPELEWLDRALEVEYVDGATSEGLVSDGDVRSPQNGQSCGGDVPGPELSG